MRKIIDNMIDRAVEHTDYELAKDIKSIVDTLAETFNAPSNWRDIGEELAKEIDLNDWIYEELELWNYCD